MDWEITMRRKIFKTSLIISSCIGFSVLIIVLLWKDYYYYKDYNEVKNNFNNLPGISITKIWGNEEIVLEDIGADIKLISGEKMGFFNLDKQSFTDAKHLAIYAFNNWSFRINYCVPSKGNYDKEGKELHYWFSASRNAIDVGSEGEMRNIIPFKVRNIQDIVSKVKEMSSVIEKIPTYPDFGRYVDPDGNEIYYQKYLSNMDYSIISSKKDCDFEWKINECRCEGGRGR